MTKPYTKSRPAEGNDHFMIVTWAGMTAGDVGDPIKFAQLPDRTVQVSGLFDGATVVIEGSIDGSEYHTLTDPQGNALSFTSGGLEAITEVVGYLRPAVTGGASPTIDVNILMRG
jgi:hypothetical protein